MMSMVLMVLIFTGDNCVNTGHDAGSITLLHVPIFG